MNTLCCFTRQQLQVMFGSVGMEAEVEVEDDEASPVREDKVMGGVSRGCEVNKGKVGTGVRGKGVCKGCKSEVGV